MAGQESTDSRRAPKPEFTSSRVASIFVAILMPTSVHIPKPLLDAVDRKARGLQISRNRLIIGALEREVTQGSDWSPGFFAQLSAVDADTAAAADEMLAAIRARRRSKKPRRL
jgi:hypothetical protein